MRLVADTLSASRGGDRIFSGLSFTVIAGEALIVTGPNGAGKSTLLRVLAGLLRADEGRVVLDPMPSHLELVGEACHYLGHRNAMKRELTVRENLAFWAAFTHGSFGKAATLAVDEAAEAVGLDGVLHLPFGYLSAGQQRRIAMAKLLVAHRPVWLLDEPTAALDLASERNFAGIVNRHLAAGGLAVIATHQPLDIDRQVDLAMGQASAEAAHP